jgi:hypothetical protein
MKCKNISICIICTLLKCSVAYTQTASVEKSTFAIQTGFLGVWINNEAKLSNQIAMRTEFGMYTAIINEINSSSTGFIISPVITAEPRWYYNLDERVAKGKNISGNSGNFFSINISYMPNWFEISNIDISERVNGFSVTPTWGIKRNFGKNFNYETGIGVGYGRQIRELNGYWEGVDINLHLRIGYRL